MSDVLTIEIDTTALVAAIDRVGAVAERRVLAAAKVTADRIVAEARSRVARRTGRTATGITAEVSRDGQAYVVLPFDRDFEVALLNAGNNQQAENLPLWLEFGTQKMTARPYFFVAARLEESAHLRRVRDAITTALAETGLGA